MPAVFMVVSFPPNSYSSMGIDGRDEIEDALDDDLQRHGIGEVTGGGSGIHGSDVDLEVYDESRVNEAVATIQATLARLSAPSGTRIRKPDPPAFEYRIPG